MENTGWDFFWMLAVLLAGLAIGWLIQRAARTLADKTDLKEGAFRKKLLLLISRMALFPSAVLGICFSAKLLYLTDWADERDAAVGVLGIVVVIYVVYQLVELMDYWMRRISAKMNTSPLNDMMVPLVRKTLRSLVVIFGVVQIAQELSGNSITSILAGLGVGGLAVALAAQDTIKNFFGSLVIFTDHPFQMGDRIVVNDTDGTVEEVGMRSTRIRTLDGHLVTVPNGELANLMIRNVSKRPFIKRVANITITYDTPPEKVERAMEIIKGVLDAHNEKFHPDFPSRVFFNNFNDCSLNILVIYWFSPPDYWSFMEFDQMFNLTILKRFNEEGIEFAFPTQTLHVNAENA